MADNLSPREAEILRLVASGKTTKEISSELSIADSTVNWHVGNVHTKLGASNRAEAVAVALTKGIIGRAGEPQGEATTPSHARPRAERWSVVASESG
jgi:DNA-binding CsgD family transcriptional regulator